MSASTKRRPLPALAFLLVLSVLTAVVWWRVLHRPSTDGAAAAPTVPRVTCTPGKKPVLLPKPAAVTVRVLNGTNRDHLAATVTTQLKARGFATVAPTDAGTSLTGVAEIRYGSAGKSGATLLHYTLPAGKLVAANRSDARIDLVLGNAYTALAPAGAVNLAVAAAKKGC